MWNRSFAPNIRNFSTKQSWVVSFMPYSWDMCPQYPMNRTPGGPWSRTECCGNEINRFLAWNPTSILWLSCRTLVSVLTQQRSTARKGNSNNWTKKETTKNKMHEWKIFVKKTWGKTLLTSAIMWRWQVSFEFRKSVWMLSKRYGFWLNSIYGIHTDILFLKIHYIRYFTSGSTGDILFLFCSWNKIVHKRERKAVHLL
jgi:hypothetical protein